MDDWKLNAKTVVKLQRDRNMFVSSCLFQFAVPIRTACLWWPNTSDPRHFDTSDSGL